MDPKSSRQMEAVTEIRKKSSVDQEAFLSGLSHGTRILEYGPHRDIFQQGEPGDSVFYLRQGLVKMSVTSAQGKEVIVAVLGPGEFFGEGCLAGEESRIETATAMTDVTLTRVEKSQMARALHEQRGVLELFLGHLLSRKIRYEEDLIDMLLNTSEKRLARTLILLAQPGKDKKANAVLPRVNQETLAQMVGTTRSRVSHFMHKFKERGLIDYNSMGGLRINDGLANI